MRTKAVFLAVTVALLAATGTARAATENYGQYSLMFERSAGQYWAGGSAAGQWAWFPQSETTSDISWGDPKAWPPKSAERFVRNGDWVLLDGYSDGAGRPVTQVQRVTSETIADATCADPQPLPSADGRQHYVRWTVPATGYCLDARGTITNGSTTVNFRHLQKWLPAHPCANPYFAGRTCITQVEQWWDDDNHPYALQLSRTLELARGLGMAFTNRTTFPVEWNADAKRYWHY
ncbi:hypothetical protein Kfla_6697 [Kribbella flavida DSM 17836]|uniref:Secreted protein n=1 Tax=Kribbella flavida (strain DSM 17836 / JCM 10339 / NBRC 14399) TaxID=479435 RepID=D2Q0Y8_KRIFD|nr:hypothetical protein [Kribbella flavida]ADB35689.1 hypothetical protein Kfla_6697 [Kribbella flavida DSM 17836]